MKKVRRPMVQLTLYLPAEIVRRIEREARAERLSRGDIVRRALDRYFGLRGGALVPGDGRGTS
jgi:hypothetical protein